MNGALYACLFRAPCLIVSNDYTLYYHMMLRSATHNFIVTIISQFFVNILDSICANTNFRTHRLLSNWVKLVKMISTKTSYTTT